MAWQERDTATISNLFSSDMSLRVVGSDLDERWVGPDEFLKVFDTQSSEMPEWQLEIDLVEGFEDGSFGWATSFSAMVTPETEISMRNSAVLRLEAGAWRIIQWHNSIPVSNEQVFGVELTTTLGYLVSSVLDDNTSLPSVVGAEGTMTLVFTDIVDSTVLAESVGDAAWAELIGAHESTIRRITGNQGGTVVKLLGDGSMLAFESARAAVRAAVEIQQAVADAPFAVRIGIHTGEVIHTANDVLGVTVNKAARVASAADGGEVMISSTTKDLVGSMEGVGFGEPKVVALKGLSDTHHIVEVEWAQDSPQQVQTPA